MVSCIFAGILIMDDRVDLSFQEHIVEIGVIHLQSQGKIICLMRLQRLIHPGFIDDFILHVACEIGKYLRLIRIVDQRCRNFHSAAFSKAFHRRSQIFQMNCQRRFPSAADAAGFR